MAIPGFPPLAVFRLLERSAAAIQPSSLDAERLGALE